MNKNDVAGLVERLMSKVFDNLTPGAIDHADLDGMAFLVKDAADALTALSARVETLEAALRDIVKGRRTIPAPYHADESCLCNRCAAGAGDLRSRAEQALAGDDHG